MQFSSIVAPLALVLLSGPAFAQEVGQPHHAQTSAAAPMAVDATGTVRAIDLKTGSLTIAHQEIKSLGWPAMTMAFKVTDLKLFDGVKVGSKIKFKLEGKDRIVGITIP